MTTLSPAVEAAIERPARRSSVPRRVVALVGWLVVIAVALLLLLPALLGYDRYAIVGGSMSGTFERGSLALTHEVPVEDLRVGDVITYRPPPETGIEQLVTHRIIDIHDDAGTRTFRTRGDANPAPDPWTFHLADRRQAVVATTMPLVGWALIALGNPTLRILAIGLPAALVAAVALRDLVRALRSEPDQPTS